MAGVAGACKHVGGLRYFFRAVITKYHKLGGVIQQKFILTQFWRLEF